MTARRAVRSHATPPRSVSVRGGSSARAELDFTVSTLALATLVTLVAATVAALLYPP